MSRASDAARPAARSAVRALSRALPWAYLAGAFAFVYAPVAVLVLFSLQESRLPVPPFDGPSLRWYADVLGDDDLVDALVNSGLVAAGSAAAATLLGFLAAWGLARHAPPGAGGLRLLMIAPLTVSYLIVGLGLLALFGEAGVGLSLWTAAVGHVVITLPLAFAILAASIGAEEIRLDRAARDLGAGGLAALGLVVAPAVAPSLAAAFLLSMTLSWDEFVIAFLLTRFDVTLPVEIWNLLRSGLSPRLNAVGSVVFLVSVAAVVAVELAVLRPRR
ncbi:MAG: ABC transporter permease [Paracoccaceae bacterium]